MGKRQNSNEWKKLLNSGIFNTEEFGEYQESTNEELNNSTEPSHYNVFIVNDFDTPIDFIYFTLTNYFEIQNDELEEYLECFEKNGEIYCGTFTREVAESKVVEVIECSRSNKFSLKCIMRRGKK